MPQINTFSAAVNAIWLSIFILLMTPASAADIGMASTYGHNKGRGDSSTQPVACGGRLNTSALTAAHRTLPCGSKVRVTNKRTGKQVVVVINDRGPFTRKIIDLSPAAASAIGMGYGVAPVTIETCARLDGSQLAMMGRC